MKHLTTLLLTLLVLGGCSDHDSDTQPPLIVPEGSVSACRIVDALTGEEKCEVYNSGLVCNFKSKRDNWHSKVTERLMLLNITDKRVYVYTKDLPRYMRSNKIIVSDLIETPNQKYYRWRDDIGCMDEKGRTCGDTIFPALHRETLVYSDLYGELTCNESSAEHVKYEIDNQEEILSQKNEQKEREAERQLEEKRLRADEQLKKNKI